MSQSEIQRMIDDAEKFKKEDDAFQAKIQAKQELSNYCYQLMETLEGISEDSKLTDDDKDSMEETLGDALEWADHNADLEASEYNAKRREVEGKLKPLIAKLYGVKADTAGGRRGGRGGRAGGGRRR